jgi:DNA-binding MarR family transcriptional regulator
VTKGPVSEWDGPEDSPGFLLWRVTLAWQRAMRAALAPHELTHVQFVLLASAWWLGETEAPTQQRLAEHAGTDPMMTSQVLRKLEDRGFVAREQDPRDARARRIVPTSVGRAVLTKALRDVERADTDFFASLGNERAWFTRGLARLGRGDPQ